MKKLKAKFDLIRYANVWEDPEMFLQDKQHIQDKSVLSIASAGDNCLALLAYDPKMVLAVDVSKVQLFLTELKAICIREMSLEACERFLGFKTCEERLYTYIKLRPQLSEACRIYWDQHIELLLEGAIHSGKFEQYLRLFSKKILPLIHKEETIKALLKQKSKGEQKGFYDHKWNTIRWKILFKVFFSRFLMGRLGRDPSFLKEVKVNVSQFFLKQSAKALSSEHIHRNHMMHYCLTGSFGELRPFYLRPENFYAIKKNIHRLHFECAYIDELSKDYGPFDFFNLSNIFEYMDDVSFHQVEDAIQSRASKDAVFAYWNLMVPRKMGNTQATSIPVDKQEDLGFFYRAFHFERSLAL